MAMLVLCYCPPIADAAFGKAVESEKEEDHINTRSTATATPIGHVATRRGTTSLDALSKRVH